jgi:ABC-2 type transport system permease protein
MSMLLPIVGHELRRLRRDRALPWLMLLFVAFAAYGAWSGAEWAAARMQAGQVVVHEADTIIALKRKQLADAKPGTNMFFATPQVTAFRPVLSPGGMAPLSIGQAEAYPYAARTQPLSDITMFDAFRADVDNPAVRAVGRFDLAFVIIVMLPLLLLAGSFDLWSRERERGVAALILSQPVPITSLLAGKAFARALALLPPAIIVTLGALLLVGADNPGGLIATALTVGAYGLFWILVATLINVFAKRSTDAALAGGSVWLLIVVLGPALALATADILAPAPSQVQFANEYRAASLAIRRDQRLAREAQGPEVIRIPAPHIPDRVRVFMAERAVEDAKLAPMVATHEDALARRHAVLDRLRLFLPAVAAQDALDRIAGSDADRALSFQQQAMGFKQELEHWLADRLDRDLLMTSQDYDLVPTFQFQEPAAGLFQAKMLADLGALFIACLLLGAAIILGRRAATHL